MLEKAFLHFKGIGKKKISQLQELGIQEWEHVLTQKSENIHKKFPHLAQEVETFINAKQSSNISFLVNSFHNADKWRILHQYFQSTSFFDIETDGYNNRITVIVCYHKGKVYQFIKHKNLDDFLELLDDVSLMVSFNGGSFDLPVVLRNFHIPKFPCPHIDLRWVLYHEGFTGGLKNIETKWNIRRPSDIEGVDGMEAVHLYYRWIEWKDEAALQTLLRYCTADVLSLVLLSQRFLQSKDPKFTPTIDETIWNNL